MQIFDLQSLRGTQISYAKLCFAIPSVCKARKPLVCKGRKSSICKGQALQVGELGTVRNFARKGLGFPSDWKGVKRFHFSGGRRKSDVTRGTCSRANFNYLVTEYGSKFCSHAYSLREYAIVLLIQ